MPRAEGALGGLVKHEVALHRGGRLGNQVPESDRPTARSEPLPFAKARRAVLRCVVFSNGAPLATPRAVDDQCIALVAARTLLLRILFVLEWRALNHRARALAEPPG
eukprot:5500817-Prymnesium_polylepis.2